MSPAITRMTYAEYHAAEASSAARHEFLDGAVWAMAGGSPEHGALAAAIIGQLQNALRGKPCRVYTSDVRVRIHGVGLSTYPDVSVVCGTLETAPDDPEAITNPVVLVEVLSESTEAYDRGAKAARYRRLPTLREYVLVSQSEALVELQRRNPSGSWEIVEARPGQILELASVGVGLDVGAIYLNPLGTGNPS